MKKLQCATFEGLDAKVVDVEISMTKGLPSFSVVGMASLAINEAKERVKSALLGNEFSFPPKRITINLSPSDIKKEGSQFDLVIALLISLHNSEVDMNNWFVFGELGLDGAIKENTMLYALILSLANQGRIQRAIVPRSALAKLANIPNISFYAVSHLNEAIELLNSTELRQADALESSDRYPSFKYNNEAYYFHQEYPLDFVDVKGQEVAKRAALISAAGMHNILFEGSPGCGKSMIAKRLRYILPPVKNAQILDVAKLDTLEGLEPSFAPLRPFKSPHHSSTMASIFGGGSHKAQIGEVGLAHNGILFFDELPHFSKNVLEALREPLEDKKIRISRVNTKIEYKTSFLFIAAMNPCPCGNLLSETLECRCSDVEVARYKNRLSDPFLDRIDLSVVMSSVTSEDRSSVTSKRLHAQVIAAYKLQLMRGQSALNGELSDREIEKYCLLNNEAQMVLDQAIMRFSLSFRSINKIKKTARTIADLVESKIIEKVHILEALSYRRR